MGYRSSYLEATESDCVVTEAANPAISAAWNTTATSMLFQRISSASKNAKIKGSRNYGFYSRPDPFCSINSDLNQALVSLSLVSHTSVGFINFCLGFLHCHLAVVIFVLLVIAK